MIFQEPMTSLNPVIPVGKQVEEALLLHNKISRSEAREKTLEMFEKVGIPEPEKRLAAYPHQLSGGLRQRVMIAMAMVCRPKLLIADEPTTALDVTVEAQILRLMRALRDETGMGMILISHDLGVVAEVCDYVYVMYAGRIVEQADVFELFDRPEHPYTGGLLRSVAALGKGGPVLDTIPGSVPNLLRAPEGCAFAPRCGEKCPACGKGVPELREIRPGHMVRCTAAGGKI
jgi:oligopeptide/dipeptide ABC transporter ATP-binding protein